MLIIETLKQIQVLSAFLNGTSHFHVVYVIMMLNGRTKGFVEIIVEPGIIDCQGIH